MEENWEVDIDQFTQSLAYAMQGKPGPLSEFEMLEISKSYMSSKSLDQETRDFFQSAFFILSKKNKRFIDIAKMKKMMRQEAKTPKIDQA